MALFVACAGAAPADWPTGRANPHRTGSTDDQAGPKVPHVGWVYKSPQHFIASPVPTDQAVLVGALAAFNTGALHAIRLAPDAAERVAWSKAAPYLKLPTACAPAVWRGLVIFGDGMHQTHGATLYCLSASTGRPLWQLPVPGKLVHLEGAPTIHNDRAYIGAGEGGVLCVDLKRLTLDGKDMDLPAAMALIEARWAQLTAKYEEDKKKDAQFALPPSDDDLPKPVPKVLWHKGQGQWHVDSPVTAFDGRLYVGSAFIEEEKVGKRALLCLNADDGTVVWEAALNTNPWAGATIAGDAVAVACSSIRFDAKLAAQAKGEVVVFDRATGQVRWRKDTAGVLSPAAFKDNAIIYAATDGNLVARDIVSSQRRWTYAAGTPFFAGPAVAGGVVYAADLKGVLHAVSLADGQQQWTLDVPGHPAVRGPGMVFGSPSVHRGRIYLATCNIEGEAADQPCAVVCIASEPGLPDLKPSESLRVDKQARTITIPARVAPRKLPHLREIYPIEVIATYPAPLGQKAHETIVTFEVKPSEVHAALLDLGLKPGKPIRGEGQNAGPEVALWLQMPLLPGRDRRIPIEKLMVDRATGKPMGPLTWRFTGSTMRQPDPDKPQQVYGADLSGTLAALFPVTDETVFQSTLGMRELGLLKLDTNTAILPEVGTAVQLIVEVK
jgi:outer membrane protein assembly factor BamB